MTIWIDVENASGVRQGSGPIRSAMQWQSTAVLDGAGTFSFTMPAGDPQAMLLASGRIARCWTVDRGARVEVGAGIIEQVERTPGDPSLITVTGPDLLAELGRVQVGALAVRELVWTNLADSRFGVIGIMNTAVEFDSGGSGSYRRWWEPLPNSHDGNAGTWTVTHLVSDIDHFPESGDWFLIGGDARFDAAELTFANLDFADNNVTLQGQYFNGQAWVTLPFTDGTLVGGASLRQNGNLSWTRPTDWARCTAIQGSGNWFFVRFRVIRVWPANPSDSGYFSLAEVRVLADTPTTTGVSQIMARAPASWRFADFPTNTVPRTWSATATPRYIEFDGQSVLAALVTLYEQGGQTGGVPVREHFRLGAGRTIEQLGSARTHSGVRAVKAGAGDVVIKAVSQVADAADVVTRIYPTSADGVTLLLTSRTAPAGYALNKTANFLEHVTGVAAFGAIELARRFPDISMQQADSLTVHPEMCANALFDAALEFLRQHGTEQAFYDLELFGAQAALRPGDLIDVYYQEYAQGVRVIDINAPLIMTSVTRAAGAGAPSVVRLGVATTARVAATDAQVLADAVVDSRRASNRTSTVIRAEVTQVAPPPDQMLRRDADQEIFGTYTWRDNNGRDLVKIGDLANSYGNPATPLFGVGVGAYTGGPTLTIDPTHGLRLRQGVTPLVHLRADGTAIIAGWNLTANHLFSGSGANRVGLRPADFPFYAGSETPSAAPFRVTPAGALHAANAAITGSITALTGTLHTLNVHNRLTLAASGEIVSTNYAAGVSGLRIGANGFAEFQDALVRGTLRSSVFETGVVSVAAGSLLLAKSGGALAADYTVGGTLTLAGDTWLLETGDIVRIRAYNGAGAVTDTWVSVTRTATTNEYTTSYESGDNTVTYPAGTAVVGYDGTAGGLLYLTADDANGPFYSVRTHGAAPWSDAAEVARLGNLNGLAGISSDLHGLFAGDYAGGNYLLYEPTGGFVVRAGDGNLEIDENGLTLGTGLALDSSRQIKWSTFGTIGLHEGAAGGDANLVMKVRGATVNDNILHLTADGEAACLYSSVRITATGGTLEDSILLDAPIIRANGTLRLSTPLGCVVYRDSVQSINNNSFTTLTPNTEQHDIGDCWASGNAERFVAPENGYYSMSAHIQWAAGGTTGFREMLIQHRDSTPTFQHNIAWQRQEPVANEALEMSLSANRVYMAAGTYLIVVVRQNSGGALNVAAATANEIYKHSMRFARVA